MLGPWFPRREGSAKSITYVSLGRASSIYGGGGSMGCGDWVILMESELSVLIEGWRW